jgi:hypothetical protein
MHINWNRLSEPSTYAGLAGVFQGLKLILPHYAAMLDGLTMFTGSVAMLRRDPGAAK